MEPFSINHIKTEIKGRYLVQPSKNRDQPSPLFVGFHGYAENAGTHLERMINVPGSDQWICCAIQALHPFYNRYRQVGASWMTSEDRNLRIDENICYIDRVVSEIRTIYATTDVIVFNGFSQGTAMACRAAILGEHHATAIILMGGDIPFELDDLQRLQHVLIGRGLDDNLYNSEIFERDANRLKKAGLNYSTCQFDGAHVWNEEFSGAVGEFLRVLT